MYQVFQTLGLFHRQNEAYLHPVSNVDHRIALTSTGKRVTFFWQLSWLRFADYNR